MDEIIKVETPQEIVPIISVEEKKQSFDTVVYDDVTYADLIKESFESINKVENEIYKLFEQSKAKVVGGNNEQLLVFGQQAKDFMELISKQNESRAKIITASTNIIKATQPANAIANVINNSSQSNSDSDNKQESISEIFSNLAKEHDPLKKAVENQNPVLLKENNIDTNIGDDISKRLQEEDATEIIYAPSYYKDLEKRNKVS